MTDLSAWYAAREYVRRALEADLMGGGPQDEELHERPLDRFIVGILHPVSPALVEDASAVPETETGTAPDSEFDPGVNLAHLRYPSSMGLTFSLDPVTTPGVTLEVSANRYVPSLDETSSSEASPSPVWRRVPIPVFQHIVDVRRPARYGIPVADGLNLRIVVRPAAAGVVSVTAVLVNSFPRPERGDIDGWCWFRPQIIATTPEGSFSPRRPGSTPRLQDPDDQANELLYRDSVSAAVGHGCAVTWDQTDPVVRIETTYFPRHEIRAAKADRPDVEALDMASLSETGDRSALHALVDAYDAWIARQETRLAALDGERRAAAERHLRAAHEAAGRMRRGIETLDSDPVADEAFRVMNAVMREQRSRQDMLRTGTSSPSGAAQYWRPFQLAFILINLEGIVDRRSRDREIADLLWFPTGGGKTEAYLGLIAFTLLLRRLRRTKEDGGGVGVLMRYTLRLLTLQQFERAAGLICALEIWRRRHAPSLAPFSIGLWVGQAATPNSVDDARRALRRAETRGDDDEESGNPRQLLRCPWCGTDLPLAAYDADRSADRLVIRCPGLDCPFHDGLPVHVVDSDVYKYRPSLLIGTVDKFAMLTWEGRAGTLLGADGAVDPPDLIVQDELHLISGPLGTLVGLYETAVDAAATGEARPKVVASTATIRRATDQVRAVFDRESRQFPPPGIDPDDSFFSVSASREELATREYVGVMAPGTSHATLMVRTYAALLQAGVALDAGDEVRDAYWTLLGYFNSLRVLGAAYMQTIDDVPDRIGVVAQRSTSTPREIREPRELTSRRRSGEIPEELARLGTSYPDPEAPDVVLATNMISVGVDVDRLGLMVVMGQPQTTAEYIQATSRVGRKRPGLVVTLYNASRTRDLSHYETFIPYHRALYRQVEATGATPFAARAVDRGLHGMLVAAARLLVEEAADDRAVAVPTQAANQAALRSVILQRVRSVAPEEVGRVEDALDDLLDTWESAVEDDVSHYTTWTGAKDALVTPAGGPIGGGGTSDALIDQFPVSVPPWPTLTSLRNVDAESTLFVVRRGRRSRRA
jgi:hypothetical protein